MAISANSSSNVSDYLFKINELNRPKVADMSVIKSGVINSAVTMIARLIMLRKGTLPDFPDAGVDIVGRYRFSFDRDLDMLATDIEEQIYTYLPEFLPVQVTITVITDIPKRLNIGLIINEVQYNLVYNVESNTLENLMTAR